VNGLKPFQHIGSLRPQRTASPFVPLAVQAYAKRPIKVDVGHTQVCDLLDPGPTVIEEHQERSITERERAFSWQRPKQRIDLFAFHVKRVWRLSPLGGDSLYSLCFCQHLRMMNSEIAIASVKGSEPLVSGTHLVSPRGFNHAQELQDSFRREIGKCQACNRSPAGGCNMN